jgi:predicted dehydrogenase
MRIGFAGVAHSHPFSDARNARFLGVEELAVWDADDPDRLDTFARQLGAKRLGSLDELLGWCPDVVIVTTRPFRTAPTVAAVLHSGRPCFLNKVPAASLAALDALDQAVAGHESHFMTSSVLRFAPALRELTGELVGRRIVTVHAVVRHGIDVFLTPQRRWQDDPADGGGTAVSMGLHGWEIADALLGEAVEPIGGAVARLPGSNTWSEDVGLFCGRSATSALVSVEVAGVGREEAYSVHVQTDDGRFETELGGDDVYESLGYVGCLRAVLELAAGAEPAVPWEVSRRVVRTTVQAARLARSNAGTSTTN